MEERKRKAAGNIENEWIQEKDNTTINFWSYLRQ